MGGRTPIGSLSGLNANDDQSSGLGTHTSIKMNTRTPQPDSNSAYVSIQGNPHLKPMGRGETSGSNKAFRSQQSSMKHVAPRTFDLKRTPGAIKTETQLGFTGRNFDSPKSAQPWTKDPDYEIGQTGLRSSRRSVAPVNPQRNYDRPKTHSPALASDMLSKLGLNLLKSNVEPKDLLSKIGKQENLVTYHPGAMPKRGEKSKPLTHKKHKRSITLGDSEKTYGIIDTEPVLDSGLCTQRDHYPERLGASLYNNDVSQCLSPISVSRYLDVGSRVPCMEIMRMVPELLEPELLEPDSAKPRSNGAVHSNYARMNTYERASPNEEYDDECSITPWSVKGIKRLRLDQNKPMASSRNQVRIHIERKATTVNSVPREQTLMTVSPKGTKKYVRSIDL